MPGNKWLAAFLVLSLAGHAVVLSVAGFFPPGGGAAAPETVTVRFAGEDMPERQTGKLPQRKAAPSRAPRLVDACREDTVSLEGDHGRYAAYLRRIKERIERGWQYPAAACARQEEGVTILRLSIHRSGALSDQRILSSSGFPALDEGAAQVVRSAAPYDPLPPEFGLTTLHVVAAFQYRLLD